MTLLTVAQNVADAVGLPRPTSVANATDQLGRQMLALANEVLEDLCDMDWPVLTRVHEFNTVANTSQYNLPTDYERVVNDTAYVASEYYAMRGSLTPQDWRARVSGFQNYTGRFKHRIFGSPLKINITPVPTTVEAIVMEYITNNCVIDGNGNPGTAFSSDGDTSVVPEKLIRMGLKWKIKHAKGLDYSEDYNAYEAAKRGDFAQQLALPTVMVGRRYMPDIPELGDGYVPDTGFGS